jgi:hypothetical protein
MAKTTIIVSAKTHAAYEQYLRHLQNAEGRLRGMNTAQAGDLVANLGS